MMLPMNNKPYLAFFFLLFLPILNVAADQIVIITHPQTQIDNINKKELNNLYLGRTGKVRQTKVILFQHKSDSTIKKEFLEKVNGMDIAKYEAFWAILKFSGRKLPPYISDNEQKMLGIISNKINSIGYIYKKNLNSSVKVLLELP